jgi:hypothetical protein
MHAHEHTHQSAPAPFPKPFASILYLSENNALSVASTEAHLLEKTKPK